MIKVEKDLNAVPDILNSFETQTKRNEIIEKGKWLDAVVKKSVRKRYEKPYRNRTVKTALKAAYKNKCAFCEQKLTSLENFPNQLTIEHFRPKSRYYWLVYSYDNLLPTCSACNSAKDNHFDTLSDSIIHIEKSEFDFIHNLTAKYNETEQPKFIHPELEDLSAEFIYHKDGTVSSDNIRCQYVIDKCELKRSNLILKRRRIIDNIKTELIAIFSIKDESTRDVEIKKLEDYLKKNGNSKNKEFSNLYRFFSRNFEHIRQMLL